MKEHFRFLREHRETLKLRVNAAEDLLLNGVREPTHRGVCQHLLAKVERSRVLAVSERMTPAEATRFLAGILRFAPELPYVLRFLACVRESASHEQAAAALGQALRHLDFDETSAAQVRQILTLMVEIFPRRELPVLLFGLLSGAAFRKAFDRSSEALPASLAEMLVPLRTARAALFREGRRREREGPNVEQSGEAPGGDDSLERGVRLLLEGATQSLLELDPPQRRRLFELGCDALRGAGAAADPMFERLLALLRSLTLPNDAERASALRRLIGAALAAGRTARVRSLLDDELRQHPDAQPFTQWRRLLDAPRVGPIAIDSPDGRRERAPREQQRKSELPPAGRWYRGWHVPTQTSVRIRYGEAAEAEHFHAIARTWRGVLVPGVERILEFRGEEQPFLALRTVGRSLARALGESQGVELATFRSWSLEACQLLAAIARSGVALPDADPYRFSVDPALRLWLVDPWGAESRAPEAAEPIHARHARELVGAILSAAPASPLSAEAREALSRAETFDGIVAALETR